MRQYWTLIRGEHGVLAALAASASCALAGGGAVEAALAGASAFLAEGGLFAHNDVANVEEDRVNRPWAPLPSGAVPPGRALALAAALLASGALLAALLGPAAFAVYAAAAVLGPLYNARLKRVPFLGNLAVALLTSLTYVYGMAAAGSLHWALLLLFACSLVANLGRELVKSAMDLEGDLRAGVRTAAAVLGPRAAAALGASVTLASVPLGLWLAAAAYGMGLPLLAAGAAATSAALGYLSWEALRGRWELYRRGSLAAFGATLGALALQALWR